jgi:long-chain acyl-CoA synthetase
MFLARVRETPDREAYRFPGEGAWVSRTWGQTGQRVTRLAAGLVSLGVGSGERVAIASSTRYEWIVADLAVMCCGAATTTVYPTSIGSDVAFILADSDSQVVFAEDDTQVAKLRSSSSTAQPTRATTPGSSPWTHSRSGVRPCWPSSRTSSSSEWQPSTPTRSRP